MTTRPSAEDYIRLGRSMTTPALSAIAAFPLTGTEQETLNRALDSALSTARQKLQSFMDHTVDWVRDNQQYHRYLIESTASGYTRELAELIKAVENIKAMQDNAKRGRIVAKSDA